MFSISFYKNLVHYIIKSSSEGYQPTLLDMVHLHNASKGKEVCFKVKGKAGVHYHISSTGDGTRKRANEAEEAFVSCRTEETKGRVLWRARDKGVYICVTRFPMRSSHGGRLQTHVEKKTHDFPKSSSSRNRLLLLTSRTGGALAVGARPNRLAGTGPSRRIVASSDNAR